MPSQNVWPPPPIETAEPIEYDVLLKRFVRETGPWRTQTRSTLARQLRRATKKDRRTSVTVVNDFCDRFQIFPKLRAKDWAPAILTVIVLCSIEFVKVYGMYAIRKAIFAAPTRAAALHFLALYMQMGISLLGLQLLIAATRMYLSFKFHRRRLLDALAKI